MHRLCAVVLAALALATPAAAQSNVEVNAGVQFDFLSPGARSLAMGGAFIGVADDATAAFVNPAGLRALSRKEVSIEARGRNFTIPVLNSGRLGGAPTNRGVDTVNGLVYSDQDQSGAGLSFLSFVYPRAKWAIAGYRHELARIDTDVTTQGAFFTQGDLRRVPIRGTMDLDIATYGLSGSYNVTDHVSVGAGVAFYTFNMDSRTDRFSVLNAQFTNPVFYGAPNFTTGNILNYQIQEGDDSAVGVNLGVIIAPSRTFQLGAVYRQGPSFDIRVANVDPTTNAPFTGFDLPGKFHVPHIVGVGAVYRPMSTGTITVDLAHVRYSRLTEDFVDLFDQDGSYSVNDGTEVHAGFEYVFPRRFPIAVRAGYWLDPEHALTYSGSEEDEVAVFRSRGDDQHHFTFGGGVVFGRFELNAAGDVSDRAKTSSVSAVVRF